jgi:uncharacterized protein with HEPN domain
MSKAIKRLKSALESIEAIEFIVNNDELKVVEALEDKLIKPAIRMHLVRLAEQFNKLKEENEFAILQHFNKYDLRGLSSICNYIAHDYDSTDDNIIEDVIRYNLPILKNTIGDLI